MQKLSPIVAFVFGLSVAVLTSEVGAAPAVSWTRTWGGGSDDFAQATAMDASGNVYVTGYFSGTVDFDPGAGVDNHTSSGKRDVFLCKFDSNGAFLWARTWGGIDDDTGNGICVDPAGNVYVAGRFQSTADFDPGPGVDSRTSNAGAQNNIFLSKFDANGNYQWARTRGGILGCEGYGCAADSSAVYLVGDFQASVDFNPDGGGDIHTCQGLFDSFICKFDLNGNFLWARSWGGTGYTYTDGPRAAIDGSGNLHVCGMFGDAVTQGPATVDFDPGPGVDNHTSVGGQVDAFLTTFDSSGNFLWARTWGGTGNDCAGGLLIDGAGNIYVSGYFSATVDFDPGAGVDNRSSNGLQDAFFCKFDSAGNRLWTRTWGGTGNDGAGDMVLDGAGNVCLAGSFAATVDFDPGSGVDNRTAAGGTDAFLGKFDSDGNLLWAQTWGGTGNDGCVGACGNMAGDVVVCGYFQGTVDFDPGAGFDNRISNGVNDAFAMKFQAGTAVTTTTFVTSTTLMSTTTSTSIASTSTTSTTTTLPTTTSTASTSTSVSPTTTTTTLWSDIVDNMDNSTEKKFEVVLGDWEQSSYRTGYNSTNYSLAPFSAGSETHRARWTHHNLPAGPCEVYVRWSTWTNGRSPAVPFDILHAGGLNTVYCNQSEGGGTWVYLGTFSFDSGANGHIVEVSNANTAAGTFIVADAVRFKQPSPTPTTTTQPNSTTTTFPITTTTIASVVTTTTLPSSDLIIDNADTLAEKKWASVAGTWSLGTSLTDKYGTNYRTCNSSATTETARSRFSTTLLPAGTYEVYAWWAQYNTRSTTVPFVTKDGATVLGTVTADQTANGGRWNLLGTYAFSAGGHIVDIHNGATGTSKSICADAVRFVAVGGAVTTTTVAVATTTTVPAPTSTLLTTTTTLPAPTDVIIDNSDTAAEKKWASVTGTWSLGTSLTDKYGTNYRTCNSSATTETARSRFGTTLLPAGTYEVYAWWAQYNTRSTTVPFVIKDGATVLGTVTADQTANGGRWNLLGTYAFSAGGHTIDIHNGATGASKSVCADAVRFVSVGP